MENGENFYFPSKDIVTSKQLFYFLYDFQENINFFFFTIALANGADKASVLVSKALLFNATEQDREKYQRIIDSPSKNFEQLKKFSTTNSKNLSVNIVDYFLWFISESIQCAMRKRPELLKSNESVKIDEIFDFRSKKEMIHYLIDRKVNALSYGGMKKIEEYMSSFLGIDLFIREEDRNIMRIFIEVRNALVHNRGFPNRNFIARLPKNTEFKFESGKTVHLKYDNLVKFANVCIKNAISIDQKISDKFEIKRIKYSTWEKRYNKINLK